MRKLLIGLLVSPILLVLVCYGCIRISNPNAGYENIRISKETTYLTEPLDETGMVDFLEGLNQRMSEGVTPENNAAVLFWQAVGPDQIPLEFRGEFFDGLGMEELPEGSGYFVSPEDFQKAHPEFLNQLVKELKMKRAAKQDRNDLANGEQANGEQENDDQEDAANEESSEGGPSSDKVELLDAIMALEDEDYPTAEDLLWDQEEQAGARPWSAEEFPLIAAWLEANREPLALVEQGALRERHYSPLMAGGRPRVMLSLLPMAQNARGFSRALNARAMRKIREGDTQGAWQDLQTCRRIGRHVGTTPLFVGLLMGIAIDGIAFEPTVQLLQEGNLSAEEVQRMRIALESLPPLPRAAKCLELGERLVFIESTIDLSLGRIDQSDLNSQSSWNGVTRWGTDHLVDWNRMLVFGNKYYDRMVEGLSLEHFPARQRALDQIMQELEQLVEEKSQPAQVAKSLLSGSARTDQISAIMVSLLLPATAAVNGAETRHDCQLQLLDLAFALELHRLEHQQYPDKLSELVPKQLDAVPKDPFTEKDFIYRLEKNGYLLYSVGQNLVDNDGKSIYDDEEESDGDDLVVRISRDTKAGK